MGFLETESKHAGAGAGSGAAGNQGGYGTCVEYPETRVSGRSH